MRKILELLLKEEIKKRKEFKTVSKELTLFQQGKIKSKGRDIGREYRIIDEQLTILFTMIEKSKSYLSK